jgi:hypothetical protein
MYHAFPAGVQTIGEGFAAQFVIDENLGEPIARGRWRYGLRVREGKVSARLHIALDDPIRADQRNDP